MNYGLRDDRDHPAFQTLIDVVLAVFTLVAATVCATGVAIGVGIGLDVVRAITEGRSWPRDSAEAIVAATCVAVGGVGVTLSLWLRRR